MAIACSARGPAPAAAPPPPAGAHCDDAAARLAAAEEQRAGGWLHQALAMAEAVAVACPSPKASRALSGARADLWLDRPAVKPDRAAIERARALYRDAVNLRLKGQADQAIRQLERSHELAPHPLTLVQLALAHRAAGREVEFRKFNARALALAEQRAGAPAALSLGGASGEIRRLAFNAAGSRLLSRSEDEPQVLIWDPGAGKQLAPVPVADASDVAWAPGNRLIVISAADGAVLVDPAVRDALPLSLPRGARITASAGELIAVRDGNDSWVWNLAGRAPRELARPKGEVLAIAADGSRFVEATATGVRIVELASGRAVAELAGEPDWVSVDRTGTTVALATDERVRVYRVADRQQLLEKPIENYMGTDMQGLAIAPDGGRVAVVRWQEVLVYDVASGEQLARVAATSSATSAAWSPDGAWLAFGDGAMIHLLDGETLEEVRILGEPPPRPRGVTFAAGELAAWAQRGRFLLRWHSSGRDLAAIALSGEDPVAAALAPDGIGFAAAPVTWLLGSRMRARDSLFEPVAVRGCSNQLAISPDGKAVAVTHQGGVIVAMGGRLLADLDLQDAELVRLGTLGGQVYVAGPFTVSAYLLHGGRPKLMWEFDPSGQVGGFKVTSDGRRLLVALEDGAVEIDAFTGRRLRAVPGPLPADFEVSPRGSGGIMPACEARTTVQVALADGTSTRWEVADRIERLAWSKDGLQVIASGAAGVEARDARTADLRERRPAVPAEGSEVEVVVDPTGRLRATAGEDGAIRLTRVRDGAAVGTVWPGFGGPTVVVDAAGHVGGPPGERGAMSRIGWRAGDVVLPGFVGWQRQHVPGLLTALLRDR